LQTQLTNALQHADKCNSAWVAFEQELLEEQQLIASTPELLRRLAEGREQRLQTARQTYQTVQGRLQQAEYVCLLSEQNIFYCFE
jgi:hypothetical protein